MPLDPARTVAELKELRELTGDENGAQRVAWTETWETARGWLREKLAGLPLEEEIDEAGNQWWTLRGASEQEVLIGGHIDSVPNGGWLDGALNVVAGVEVLRRLAEDGEPAMTVRLVNWADEEGARFGRSLFGSSAAAGSMADQDELRQRRDAEGTPLPDALAAARGRARPGARRAQAARERRRLPRAAHRAGAGARVDGPRRSGVVLGTFGVERHQVTFTGQAAHAGSTPMDKRRDALGGRGQARARDPGDREAHRRGRGLHDGRRRDAAGDRDLGGRDRRVPARPAPPRRGQARGDARATRRRLPGGSRRRRTSRSPGSGSGTSSRSSSTTR